MVGSGPTALNLKTEDQQYLLSAALIVSALLSLIQITRFKIWRTGKNKKEEEDDYLNNLFRLLCWNWFIKCSGTQLC
jgi:hypothetical protein